MKRKEESKNKLRNESGDITSDTTEIQRENARRTGVDPLSVW